MRKRFFIWFTVLYLTCITSHAQSVSVRATLDTNKGLIGDQFLLRLQVEKPAGSWKVNFPVVAGTLGSEIEILKINPIDSISAGTGHVLSQELLVTVFDTGFFEIPSLPFTISNASFTDTLNTIPVLFEIQAMKPDSTIRDIKAIYTIPLSFREVAPYLVLLVLLIIVTILLIRYVKKRKPTIGGVAVKTYSEPADVIALRELSMLKDEKPWLNNRVKYYHSRISDILRTYIERRYRILAMEQTTGEILESLRSKNIATSELTRLTDILKLADLVKFAKVIPDPEQNAMQVGHAAEFVQNTPVHTEKIDGAEVMEINTKQESNPK